MFKNMEEVIEANESAGKYFFSKDTLSFFKSKVESELLYSEYFITSEKACFSDSTRVYNVRRVLPSASIETVERGFATKKEAKEYIDNI